MSPTLSRDPVNALTGFCQAWKNRDLDGALQHVDLDIRCAMYVPEDVFPFGGETRGKAAMSGRLRTILAQFYTVQFEESVNRQDNDTVYAQVDYAFRHKATQETIDGVMRLIMHARNSLIIGLKDYHDVEKIRAFMRLVSYLAAGRTSR